MSRVAQREEILAAVNSALRAVGGLCVSYSQLVADRLGINATDLECLDVIVAHGGVAAGDLARATGLTTGAVTGVIDRLERAGFARRAADPQDRRRVRVLPLIDTHERLAPLYAPMERFADDALAGFDEDQLVLALEFLTRLQSAGQAAAEALKAESHLPAASRF